MNENSISRKNMVLQQVRPWYVVNEDVLHLMRTIPREQFVPDAFKGLSYCDADIPLGHGQTMLSPKVVGRALQALDIQSDETVLEVGTGTGYITALLAHLAMNVISIEIHDDLLQVARKNLSTPTYKNVHLELGCGAMGWTAHATYHKVFITGSYPIELPSPIKEQVAPGGKIFAFIGAAPSMQATLFHRIGDTWQEETLFETVVPELENAPKHSGFVF